MTSINFTAASYHEAANKLQAALGFLPHVSGEVGEISISLHVSPPMRCDEDFDYAVLGSGVIDLPADAPATPARPRALTMTVDSAAVEVIPAEAPAEDKPKRTRKAKPAAVEQAEAQSDHEARQLDIEDAVQAAVEGFVDGHIEDERANGKLIPTRDEMVAMLNRVAQAHPKKAAGAKEMMAAYGGTTLNDVALGDWPALMADLKRFVGEAA
jgi:hypothetical protein